MATETEIVALESVQQLLPESLRHIVTLIGYQTTFRLVETLGGTTFSFGKFENIHKSHQYILLSKTVGGENAQILYHHFTGSNFYIPKASAAMREYRNQEFIKEFNQMRDRGISILTSLSFLCPKFNISDRWAWELLNKYKVTNEHKQKNLF